MGMTSIMIVSRTRSWLFVGSFAMLAAAALLAPLSGHAAEPGPDRSLSKDAAPAGPPQPVDAVRTPEQRQQALDALYDKLAKTTDDTEATAMLSRPNRDPWKLPDA